MSSAPTASMKIEIWSDIMCPYCYLGLTKFEQALNNVPESKNFQIHWKSFQLDPSIPQGKSNLSNYEYVAQKYGWSTERSRQAHESIVQAGKDVGLDYNFEQMQVANTLKAHCVIQYAQSRGLGTEAERLFFKAYFTEGKDLSDVNDLNSIVAPLGLTAEDVQTALSDVSYSQQVQKDIDEARQLGINGVPFFIFNRQLAVSGAQPPEVFMQAIQQALAPESY